MIKYILYNKDHGVLYSITVSKHIKTCGDKVECQDKDIFNFVIKDRYPREAYIFDTIEEAVSSSYDCYIMNDINTEILVVEIYYIERNQKIGWIQNKNELGKAIFNNIENNIKKSSRIYFNKDKLIVTKAKKE